MVDTVCFLDFCILGVLYRLGELNESCLRKIQCCSCVQIRIVLLCIFVCLCLIFHSSFWLGVYYSMDVNEYFFFACLCMTCFLSVHL